MPQALQCQRTGVRHRRRDRLRMSPVRGSNDGVSDRHTKTTAPARPGRVPRQRGRKMRRPPAGRSASVCTASRGRGSIDNAHSAPTQLSRLPPNWSGARPRGAGVERASDAAAPTYGPRHPSRVATAASRLGLRAHPRSAKPAPVTPRGGGPSLASSKRLLRSADTARERKGDGRGGSGAGAQGVDDKGGGGQALVRVRRSPRERRQDRTGPRRHVGSMHVADHVRTEFEVQVDGDEIEVEIELSWSTSGRERSGGHERDESASRAREGRRAT